MAGLSRLGAGNGLVDGGVTVNIAVLLTPLDVAVTVTLVFAPTVAVVTVKFALVAPAATVTLAGTLATDEFELLRLSTAPPLGAPLLSVTVPVDGLPPTTLVGLTVSAVSDGGVGVGCGAGFTVKVADWVTPAPDTEMMTGVDSVTALVKILKLPRVVPAGIITLLFTLVMVGWLLVSGRIRSVDGGDATVTIPRELPPVPTVEVGSSVNDVGGC